MSVERIHYDKIQELEQENKRLKEDLQRWKNNFGNLETEWENQKVLRLEVEGMNTNLKEKLEKIVVYVKDLDNVIPKHNSDKIRFGNSWIIIGKLKEIISSNQMKQGVNEK